MIRELKARLKAAIKEWQRNEWERSGRVPDMYVSDYGYRLEVQFADEEDDDLYKSAGELLGNIELLFKTDEEE